MKRMLFVSSGLLFTLFAIFSLLAEVAKAQDSHQCEGTFRTGYPCSNAVDGDWTTWTAPDSYGGSVNIIENHDIPPGAAGAKWIFRAIRNNSCIEVKAYYWDYQVDNWVLFFEAPENLDYVTYNIQVPANGLISSPMKVKMYLKNAAAPCLLQSAEYYDGDVQWLNSSTWCDDFEGYPTSSGWSANWHGSGNTSGISVVSTYASSGSHSLRMYGITGACWGAVATHPIDLNLPMEITSWIRNGSENLTGCHPFRGVLALRSGGPDWWDGPAQQFVVFLENGGVRIPAASGAQDFPGYPLGAWHHVKCQFSNLGDGQLHVKIWINEDYLGEFNWPFESWMEGSAYIDISSQEGTVWFDDVCVGELEGEEPPGEPGYFIHISDIHVGGDYCGGDQWWTSFINLVNNSPRFEPKPKFVFATGDLVETGWTYTSLVPYVIEPTSNWNRLISSLNLTSPRHYSVDNVGEIPVYFCPGNHDAKRNLLHPFSDCRPSYIHEGLGAYTEYMGPPIYVAEMPELRMVMFSLYTGVDEQEYGGLCLPEGNGMTNESFEFVKDVIPNYHSSHKIAFMHHPFWNTGGENGFMDGSFLNHHGPSTTGDDFAELCLTNGIELVLGGHVHDDALKRWSYNGEQGMPGVSDINHSPWNSGDGTRFVATGALKDGWFRRIYFDGYGNITSIGRMESIGDYNHLGLCCYAEVHVYDDNGNHIGPTSDGGSEYQIPNVYYSSELGDNATEQPENATDVTIPANESGNFTVLVRSLSTEPLNIELSSHSTTEESWGLARYENVWVDSGATTTIEFTPEGFPKFMSIIYSDESVRRFLPTRWYGNQFHTLSFGSLEGTVREGTLGGIESISLNLLNEEAIVLHSIATDRNGRFNLDSITNGSYVISLVTPLGYDADSEVKEVEISGLRHSIDFNLNKLSITPQQRTRGYWAFHAYKAFIDHPIDYTTADFGQFTGLIKQHFNENSLNPVDFYSVPQPATATDSLNVLKTLLLMESTGGTEHFQNRYAKSELMSMMLNVVSGKISQTHPISEDGRTVSQAITYCDYLINGIPADMETVIQTSADSLWKYRRAIDVASKVNSGVLVSAGKIPEEILDIAYRQNLEVILPSEYSLGQNYPNPFNPTTTIEFSLPKASEVELEIFNISGQKVATLVNTRLEAGNHTVTWDSRSTSGEPLASGIYLYRLKADTFVETKKMMLLK